MNDLVIHTYQFIRLYVLYCYSNNKPLPELNDTFISYCINTLGTRDNIGKKCKDTELLESLEEIYNSELKEIMHGNGPRKIKENKYGYFEATIKKEKKVWTWDELQNRPFIGTANNNYWFYPCYIDIDDKSTLKWRFFYYIYVYV